MKRLIRSAALIIVALSVSLGSVFMVLAKNTALTSQNVAKSTSIASVDPIMAILAAIIVGIVGIIAFAKRNLTK